MNAKEAFPGILAQLRATREFTQAELAGRAGLPPATISHFETGFRFPTAATLHKLADALGVTVDFLLGRETDARPAGPRYEALFRNFEALSDESLEELEWFSERLAEKDRKKRGET